MVKGSPILKFFHATKSNIGFSSLAQAPTRKVLQKFLEKGEYPSFQSVAMFESTFVQVTRRGRHVFIHNHCNEAIIGIASTNTNLPLPNLMIIARPAAVQIPSESHTEELILTRLLPLKFVRISIYDPEKQLIKIKLINGRSYYLQFRASTEEEEKLFDHWLSLIHLLHHPPACYLRPQPTSCTLIDNLSIEVIPSEDEAEDVKKIPPPKQQKKQKEQKEKGRKQEKEKAKQLQARVKMSRQSKFSSKEEYTEQERQMLQAGPDITLSTMDLFLKMESFESYKGSDATARMSK
ncbi:Golgi-associated RAB2B interactor protein 3-like [Elgaria multicarinata webbii]|uniref:Golgi-associated RAB2B interactor protein 3-like n=1 Tax=Elgaria multicarinata webbii TaxID=159646 RepID=UPI002FCD5D07